jgi:hypothetical protein
VPLLLRFEHDLDVNAFLGAEFALLFAEIEAVVLISLLGLDVPVDVEFVWISYFKGTHEAGLAFPDDTGVEGDVVRLQIDNWLNSTADKPNANRLN